jgi:hypothetical protein
MYRIDPAYQAIQLLDPSDDTSLTRYCGRYGGRLLDSCPNSSATYPAPFFSADATRQVRHGSFPFPLLTYSLFKAAFLVANGSWCVFNGSSWSATAPPFSINDAAAFAGALCSRQATPSAPQVYFDETLVSWNDAEKRCWDLFNATLCSPGVANASSARSNEASYWIRTPGGNVILPGYNVMLDAQQTAMHGVACCGSRWNSSWSSISAFGTTRSVEIRAQCAQPLPNNSCSPGNPMCYWNYFGGLFLVPIQGSRFSEANFGVDGTPPTMDPPQISNSAAHIDFAFDDADVFGNAQRYGGFSSRAGQLPTCKSDCSAEYGCTPCPNPYDSLWLLNQTDVIEVTIAGIVEAESGTPKVQVLLYETCGDRWCQISGSGSSAYWFEKAADSASITLKIAKPGGQNLTAGRGYVLEVRIYNGAGFVSRTLTSAIVADPTPPSTGKVHIVNAASRKSLDVGWINSLDRVQFGLLLGCHNWSTPNPSGALGFPERVPTSGSADMPVLGDWVDRESAVSDRRVTLYRVKKGGTKTRVRSASLLGLNSVCTPDTMVSNYSRYMKVLALGASSTQADASAACSAAGYLLCEPYEALYARWSIGHPDAVEGWTSWNFNGNFSGYYLYTDELTMFDGTPKSAPQTYALCCSMVRLFWQVNICGD